MNSMLAQCVAAAKERGLMGVVVIDQGGPKGYTAMCMSKSGAICDPRAWECHFTPDLALTDLADKLGITAEAK